MSPFRDPRDTSYTNKPLQVFKFKQNQQTLKINVLNGKSRRFLGFVIFPASHQSRSQQFFKCA